MNVVITRDVIGVQVWPDDIKIEFSRDKLLGRHSKAGVWLVSKFHWRKPTIFNSKEVEQYFPHLVQSLAIGQKKNVVLSFTENIY